MLKFVLNSLILKEIFFLFLFQNKFVFELLLFLKYIGDKLVLNILVTFKGL